MLKLIQSLALFFLVSVAVYGQAAPLVTFSVDDDPPVGTRCSAFGTLQVNKNNGNMWTCPVNTSVWTNANQGTATNPGGAPNSIQFNNAGSSFGGVLNGSATKGYLTQTSGGTPTFQLVPIPEPDGGTGTVAPLNGLIQGNGAGPFTATAFGNQLTYARMKPNSVTSVLEFATPSIVESVDYNFSFAPLSGSITGGALATVTMPIGPLGTNGTDLHHRLWVFGGTGTNEAVTISGGTCVPGLLNCTLQFTPTNSHTGAFQVGSATAGTQEAVNKAFTLGGAVHMQANAYDWHGGLWVDITTNHGLQLYGDGYGYHTPQWGTVINNLSTDDTITINGDALVTGCEIGVVVHDFSIHGSPTSGSGIKAINACPLRVYRIFEVDSGAYGLVCSPNCYTLDIQDSLFYSNGSEGVYVANAANAVHMDNVATQSNCKQVAGLTCQGILISDGLNVTITNSSFALDGVQPIAGYPSFAPEVGIYSVHALVFNGNYCEQPLSGCLYGDGNVSEFDISGNYMQQGGIYLTAGAAHGQIAYNHMTDGSNNSVTITNVTNNGGFCQITVASAPTVPFTVQMFEGISGVGGATACNDNGNGDATLIQSVQSTTQFTTIRVFGGGAYTSGGTTQRAGGFFIGGSANTYSDIHIPSINLDFTNGPMQAAGGDLLPGPGGNITAASSIKPLFSTNKITGLTPVSTIIAPSGFAGQWCSIPTGALSFTTGGNLAAAFTATANVQKCFNYVPADQLWY